MSDALERALGNWVRFAGGVLVVAILYWAQAILVPLALAILLTFVLTPPVMLLQRLTGRVAAVLVVVALVFTLVGLAVWGVAAQMSHLAADLPHYQDNIRQKIADVRGAGRAGSVQQVQKTLENIQRDIEEPDTGRGTSRRPLVVRSEPAPGTWSFASWLGPAVGPLSTAGFVITLVIFMLLEREELRGRVIGLVGHGNLAVTTKALDEASARVSRQLLMQTLVNTIYGVIAGTGLWLIGVPYPLLWAALGGALRFIPYLGPIAAAGAPILVSLAALPGWKQPLMVAGFYTVLELFTNLVLETVLYAGAAGVSEVALLVAVAFWTWLWGSLGLLMATPLTVCLIVLGKHAKGLEFLSTLMADSPALSADVSYYQRLLARDQSEASEIVQRHLVTQPTETVYDALLLPALNYAERDRLEGRLSEYDERIVTDGTRELLNDVQTVERALRSSSQNSDGDAPAPHVEQAAPPAPVQVLAYPVNEPSDAIALEMLAQLVAPEAIHVDVRSSQLLASEIIELVRDSGVGLICIADLPPSPPSKTRYVVRKLRAALPDVKVLVGRWAPEGLADDEPKQILDAGANHVATTLVETRDQLRALATLERQRAASAADTAAGM